MMKRGRADLLDLFLCIALGAGIKSVLEQKKLEASLSLAVAQEKNA
jgi:hypothetical protein